MSARPSPRRFTSAEYRRLVDAGIVREDEKVELIDGEIVGLPADLLAMSPQGPKHSALTSRIVATLHGYFPRDQFCVQAHSPLQVGADSVPEPDIAVVAGPCEEHEKEWPRSALVVVEVSVTSQSFDRGRKALLYGRGAVGEYWVVDTEARTVTVHRRPSPTGWEEVTTVRESESVTPAGRGPIPVAGLLPAP